nr:transposase, MuDR [Tanacetum cinerariifolium]
MIPTYFPIKVNHGGAFTYVSGSKRTRAPRRVYKGGNVNWFDEVNADGFFVIELSDKGLEPLRADINVLDMLSYVYKFKLIKVFIEHPIDTSVIDIYDDEDSDDIWNVNVGLGTQESDDIRNVNVGLGTKESDDLGNANVGTDNVDDVNVGLRNDNVVDFDPLFSFQDTIRDNVDDVNVGSGNDNVDIEGSDNSEDHDDSEDNDFKCDIKDQFNDVHVDMEMFREHIDLSIEWVGPTKHVPEVETNEEVEYEECDLKRLSRGKL